MSNVMLYRTLFVGTLVQESFLSVGGTEDPYTTVDSPFCRDGMDRPTVRGTGLAGALIATLRRHLNGIPVPVTISGSDKGRTPSVWRSFNAHPQEATTAAYRQHVAIDARTGAAMTGALFDLETLPPGTCWPFLLEVDTSRDPEAAAHARNALKHWQKGRCLLGREVARGMGWMRLVELKEYTLTTAHIDAWPNAQKADAYPDYIQTTLNDCLDTTGNADACDVLPGWIELEGTINAGEREDGYGIDSLSIGGHASEEWAAAWDHRFLGPDGMEADAAKNAFDPDLAVVSVEQGNQRVPYIPGSSLRGPLRHAMGRLQGAGSPSPADQVQTLFGKIRDSAKLLVCDALPDETKPLTLAWLQQHAEDEFAGSTFGSGKFDRVAVMQGTFKWKMVLEDATPAEIQALTSVLALASSGQIGIGGGQWRGHGWLPWQSDDLGKLAPAPTLETSDGV